MTRSCRMQDVELNNGKIKELSQDAGCAVMESNHRMQDVL